MGGAIYIEGNNFYLDNISCCNNMAYSSCDVDINTGTTLVEFHTGAYSNSYGGALYLNGKGILTNSLFSNNLLFANSILTKTSYNPTQNSDLNVNNHAYGGAVFWKGYSRFNEINNSQFINNNMEAINKYGNDIYLDSFNGNVNYNYFFINTNTNLIKYTNSSFDLNYNWWGNTASNFNKKLFSDDLSINKWLFLNMSSNNSNLEIGDKSIVTLDLSNVYDSSSKKISHTYEIDNIEFNLLADKLKTNNSAVIINNGVANIEIIAQSQGQGSLIASYNGIKSTLKFTISKKSSQIITQIKNSIIYNGEIIAYLNITPNTTGTLKVYLNNDFYRNITLKNGVFEYIINFTSLSVNNYTLRIVYGGDGTYLGSSNTVDFEIKKAYNTIHISDSYTIDYGDVIILNVDKGNVTDGTLRVLIKNNKNSLFYNETYNIMDINNIILPVIDAGDYNLSINYESNNYYGSSFDYTFTVNKLNPITNKQIINRVYGKSEMLFNSSVDG